MRFLRERNPADWHSDNTAVLGKCRIKFRAILTQGFGGFPQTPEVYSETVPQFCHNHFQILPNSTPTDDTQSN
jgi:hypothetical protein